jgi:hypothetical protein
MYTRNKWNDEKYSKNCIKFFDENSRKYFMINTFANLLKLAKN